VLLPRRYGVVERDAVDVPAEVVSHAGIYV